ncbi:dynein axonemal assembly factor 6 isoform X2 [Condylostylus longicornis]|uniref:dynein axonemal assembly factor 6 isoform X2 n=1 Tax=Condylostylus longicornis TaxID=2530218 RepID=UPI00244DCB7B|nr:dynein axonemal assembly factor 6 isoform X2 [Condylostylus longicornis]
MSLQQLFYSKSDSSEESSDENESHKNNKYKIGPAALTNLSEQINIPSTKKTDEQQEKQKLPPELDREEKDDAEKWLENQNKEDLEILESRKRPEYSIIYKQVVGTEDIFLGINNRTPASMSCEDMVIQIEMPEEKISVDDMDLEVTESRIDLKTSVYRLILPLVHPINPDKGSARFDIEKKCLILTLRMKRELDFANF